MGFQTLSGLIKLKKEALFYFVKKQVGVTKEHYFEYLL